MGRLFKWDEGHIEHGLENDIVLKRRWSALRVSSSGVLIVVTSFV